MANSMPFNSVNSDRVYKAEDWAWYFSTFIKNGVFPDPSDGLKVVADSGMNLKVKPGFAFIHGYAMRNPDEYVITIDTADGAFARIDRVVVRLDHVSRDMYIHLLKGTVSDRPVAPDITRDAEIHDIVLADVTVMAGTTAITNANITDRRFDKTLCGIVTGTVEEIDPSTLTLQFETYFNEFREQFEKYMDAWRLQQEDDITAWLNSIRDALGDDIAANLQMQIQELQNKAYPSWVDGKTIKIDNDKIRANEPYINTPDAGDVWKLSDHKIPGIYSFKLVPGFSNPPSDFPEGYGGSMDFCLENIPYNSADGNGVPLLMQRFSHNGKMWIRMLQDGYAGEWKEIGAEEKNNFHAASGISGEQYIRIGSVKNSAAGNGAVYGFHFDGKIYSRLSVGGFGFVSVCLSIISTGGAFRIEGTVDNKPQAFDVVAYLSTDSSRYDLYIKTSYGGTKGQFSVYSNAAEHISISIGTGSATIPSGTLSGSMMDSITVGTVDVTDGISSHMEDVVKHISQLERDNWNGYANKIAAKADVTTQNFDVYVSPTGNDISGDGSSAKPFQTISRALLEKAQKAGYHKCTVKVAAGDYSAATGLYLDAAIRAQNVYAEIQLQGDVTFSSNGEFVMDIDNSTISITGTDKVINLTGEAASGQIYVHNDGNITMYGPVIKFNGGGAGKGILATSGGIFSQAMGRTSMDNLEDAAEASINGRIYLESVFGSGNRNGFVASSGGQVAYGTSTMTATNPTVTSKGGRVLTGVQ